jgi:hypothetical protein
MYRLCINSNNHGKVALDSLDPDDEGDDGYIDTEAIAAQIELERNADAELMDPELTEDQSGS